MANAIFAFLAGGASEPWLPEAHDQNKVVTRAVAAATSRFVAGAFETVYDDVLGRVATRLDHGFTDPEATRKMHDDFATTSIAERHTLTADDSEPKAIVERIAVLRKQGTLRYDRTV